MTRIIGKMSRRSRAAISSTRHPRNRTPYKALDKVAADPRVEKIYGDSDGIWVDLAPGWNFEGCSSLHAEPEEQSKVDPIESILSDFSRVEEGDPY